MTDDNKMRRIEDRLPGEPLKWDEPQIADWRPYHSALSRCAELLDNMKDGDPITEVPDFLAAKLKELAAHLASQSQAAQPSIKTWAERIARHPDRNAAEYVDEAKDAEIADLRAALAGQSQATWAVPGGWVPLSIVYNDDMEYPEEVAYGPPIMMNRLGKWLDKFMAQQIAMRDGMVLAPHFRGYAHLGIGAYVINHSPKGEPAELVISIATDEEKAGRTVGDSRDNAPDAMLQPEAMAVRLRFENVAGLDALEHQLRFVRSEHFAEFAAQEVTQQAAPVVWIGVDVRLPEKYCLAVYETSRRQQRIIRAMHVKQYQIEAESDDCSTDYNDANDTEYLREGWYELIDNWGEYSSVHVCEGVVTHWMPLPPTPDQMSTAGAAKGGNTSKENGSDLAPTTSTVSAPEEVRSAALEEVAKLIEKKVYAYTDECGSYDHSTGVTEYPGNGEEWVGEMGELVEEIRALRTTSGKGEAA